VKKIVLGSMIYGSVAMVLVYMPVQFVKSIFPESFPIVIKLLDPLSELPIHLLMLHFGLPLTFEYLRPRRVIRFVIHSWLRFASKVFNVDTHILQSMNADSGDAADANVDANVEGDNITYAEGVGGVGGGASAGGAGSSTSPTGVIGGVSTNGGVKVTRKISDVRLRPLLARSINIYKESWELFVQSQLTLNLRLGLLVISSCAAIQLSNACLLSLPLFLGRQLCRLIGFPVHHDPYNILVGIYMLWGLSYFLGKTYSFLSTNTFEIFLAVVLQYSALITKYFILGTLWLIAIPSILGTLVHLTFVVPWTVPLNHTPIFLIYQDWAIGLVSLKVFHKVIASIPVRSDFYSSAHIPELVFKWKAVFTRLHEEGIGGVDFKWALVDVTIPALMSLTAQLCLPYTFVHSVLPLCGDRSLYLRQVVYRYGYTMLAVVLQLNEWKAYVKTYLWKLHNTIRDDKYMVGRALKNMEHLHAS
jgi:E3 ubiquitin-protein ligase MARCH6